MNPDIKVGDRVFHEGQEKVVAEEYRGADINARQTEILNAMVAANVKVDTVTLIAFVNLARSSQKVLALMGFSVAPANETIPSALMGEVAQA